MKQEFVRVMQVPDMELYQAIVVTKNTKIEYKNDNVEQSLNDLIYKCKTTLKKENYTSTYSTTIHLKEGDIIIYESKERGYIVPVEKFMKVEDIIKEIEPLKEV